MHDSSLSAISSLPQLEDLTLYNLHVLDDTALPSLVDAWPSVIE
jgi:hypothetical protein